MYRNINFLYIPLFLTENPALVFQIKYFILFLYINYTFIILFQVPFEFDNIKSVANKEKHGIDFIEAQELWEDNDRLVIPVRNVDEPRFLIIGKINEKIWSAIFTMRQENIRIISVRRARKEEIEIYES